MICGPRITYPTITVDLLLVTQMHEQLDFIKMHCLHLCFHWTIYDCGTCKQQGRLLLLVYLGSM
jgi:hypothetical protein